MGPEAKIQTAVVAYAREQYRGNVRVKKLSTAGRFGTTGEPDYEFNWINGHTELIEFKAPGGNLTDKQLHTVTQYRALGYRVHVVEDRVLGKQIVDAMYKRALGRKP